MSFPAPGVNYPAQNFLRISGKAGLRSLELTFFYFSSLLPECNVLYLHDALIYAVGFPFLTFSTTLDWIRVLPLVLQKGQGSEFGRRHNCIVLSYNVLLILYTIHCMWYIINTLSRKIAIE